MTQTLYAHMNNNKKNKAHARNYNKTKPNKQKYIKDSRV
jgi:hypothetical protein